MTLTGALFEEVLGCSFLFCFAIRLKLLAIEEGDELGITCPPDRVPQTPAGGLRPPAPPTEELPCETCIGRMGRERSEEYIPMDLMDKLASVAQRYEELNRLMAQPEVLEDLSLLQRY